MRKRLDLSWVFLGLLICLFVWIVESPRSWDRIARPQAVLDQPILSKPRIPSQPLSPTPSPQTPRAKASAQPVQRPVRSGTVPIVVATTPRVTPGQKDGTVPVARPVAPSPSPPRLPVQAILASAPLPAAAKVGAKGNVTAASKETALPADGPALVLRLPPVTDEAVATDEAGAPVAPQPPASPGSKSSPQSDAAAVAKLAVPETAGVAAKIAANDNPPGEAISMDGPDSNGAVKNASPQSPAPSPPLHSPVSRRAQPAGVGNSPPATRPQSPAPFAWPEPETLLSQLDALASHATTSRWAQQTVKLIHTLGPENVRAVGKGGHDAAAVGPNGGAGDSSGGRRQGQGGRARPVAGPPCPRPAGQRVATRLGSGIAGGVGGGLADRGSASLSRLPGERRTECWAMDPSGRHGRSFSVWTSCGPGWPAAAPRASVFPACWSSKSCIAWTRRPCRPPSGNWFPRGRSRPCVRNCCGR